MKNETYRYLLKPDGLSEVSFPEPRLGVLKGYLCLSCDHGRTHFVVWLMREFGVENSWNGGELSYYRGCVAKLKLLIPSR